MGIKTMTTNQLIARQAAALSLLDSLGELTGCERAIRSNAFLSNEIDLIQAELDRREREEFVRSGFWA